jgi:hypothetical protein
MSQDSELNKNFLEYVAMTAPVVEWAGQRAAQDKEAADKAMSGIKRAADGLIAGRHVAESYRPECEAKLASHEGTLELLANVLERQAALTDAARGLGSPESGKQASANGSNGSSPYVGRPNGRRPSDDIWENRVAG